MLDIRYFDALDNSQATNENGLVGYKAATSSNKVFIQNEKSPQIQLEPLVTQLLADYNISGVILFSENLVNTTQIKKLTGDIQNVALSSSSRQPLLISIDQEGGRVARLPREQWPAFTGNMAIGALANDSEKLSYQVGEAIGQQLQNLGINVNHAPTIDVNANPNNPVINVRSFSDCPKRVAKLGCAMGKGMLAAEIIPTFKHFPGHGDTNVDSHTGLPRVDHSLDVVNTIDLYPFVEAIKQDCAPMIMTAHIQYPALDNSTFLARNGEQIIKPATLSYDILTTLLREKIGYEGVVITDALDMASISCYLTPVQAVINTFKAGADIALMPFKVHKPADIVAFSQFFDEIVEQVINDDELYEQVMTSYHRIKKLKTCLVTSEQNKDLIPQGLFEERQLAHRMLEKHIAEHSIVSHGEAVIELSQITQVITVFSAIEQAEALNNALQSCQALNQTTKYLTMSGNDLSTNDTMLNSQDSKHTLLIIGIEEIKSVVDLGGVDDLLSTDNDSVTSDVLLQALVTQKEQGGQSVFVCLKAPYNLAPYIANASMSLTTFDGSTYQNGEKIWQGAAFDAIAAVIAQQLIPTGQIPIATNTH